jgi:predicted transcriptional regulator
MSVYIDDELRDVLDDYADRTYGSRNDAARHFIALGAQVIQRQQALLDDMISEVATKTPFKK